MHTHNTVVISDLHLTDAEPQNPAKPYWKNFKQARHFIDADLGRFLNHIKKESKDFPVELVLNGDIFDYDSVMTLPEDKVFKITRYEKLTGLKSHEEKSLFKTKVILDQHDLFISALKKFVQDGHKVVFVIGNHDIELYWPSVQKEIIYRITENSSEESQVSFCDWFYVSQNDTLIEHGHQYDPYCMCIDPINPIIKKNKKYKVRLPFGNIANRFILNRFALKNPHQEDSYVKTGKEFMIFFFKYELRLQPWLAFLWLSGALRTLVNSLGEGFTPAIKDPLIYESKIKAIAARANVNTHTILALKELHAHPAVHRPIEIFRELWLDRFFFAVFLVWGSWQIFTTSTLFSTVSLWWFIIPILISIPFWAYYAEGITSDVNANSRLGEEKAPIAAQIVGVTRVVHGHTHYHVHRFFEGIEFLNPGSWSPSFDDLACSKDNRIKKYVWIKSNGISREADLKLWE
ncbi:MAG TPA: metallophosphoesterase [Bacteriovoracaceae bacterium]|nr:metallophosphoesterase [Bacteriovoracaceae bacterium]